jgi:hypothetical protein
LRLNFKAFSLVSAARKRRNFGHQRRCRNFRPVAGAAPQMLDAAPRAQG